MSIFGSSSAEALAELADVRLSMAGVKSADACAGPAGAAYLSNKLQAAEADVASKLGCFLEPTEVFPVPPTDDEVAALQGSPYAVEQPYDLPPDFVSFSNFGFVQLNQRPLNSITSIRLIHPSQNLTRFDLPLAWVRIERKYAQFTVAAVGSMGTFPMGMFVLQTLTGGRSVPLMMYVRYNAGLPANHPMVPLVKDTILRLAAYRSLTDRFTGQSESVSADGLSQSVSNDLSKWRDMINDDLKSIRDTIHGITGFVL